MSNTSRPTNSFLVPELQFFCVGAQKCGTTSLHALLNAHPAIFVPAQKETKFFADDNLYARGTAFYQQEHFGAPNAKVVGEVDPNYLYFPYVAERLYTYRPDAKLIVMLRNPVERAFAHYMMMVTMGVETLTFEEALEQEETRLKGPWLDRVFFSYVDRGFYAEQIRRYLTYFAFHQIEFILLDDLRNDPNGVIRRLWDFLEVSELGICTDMPRENVGQRPQSLGLARVMNRDSWIKRQAKRHLPNDGAIVATYRRLHERNLQGKRDQGPSPDTAGSLLRRYSDDIVELESLLNRDLTAWRSPRPLQVARDRSSEPVRRRR